MVCMYEKRMQPKPFKWLEAMWAMGMRMPFLTEVSKHLKTVMPLRGRRGWGWMQSIGWAWVEHFELEMKFSFEFPIPIVNKSIEQVKIPPLQVEASACFCLPLQAGF